MSRVLPYGSRALLLEVESLDEVLALYPAMVASRVNGIGELIPAARSILVPIDPALLSLSAAERWIGSVSSTAPTLPDNTALTTIDVRYDGEDLADVARFLGLDTDGVIELHTSGEWRVAFIGFAPGFAYLARPAASGDAGASAGGAAGASAGASEGAAARASEGASAGASAPLDVPRRATSRQRVAAGSVGLAGEFSGVYPRTSPGGWQLIGHTDAVLWDIDRPSPALLAPGDRVRFRAVDGPAVPRSAAPASATSESATSESATSESAASESDASRPAEPGPDVAG